MATLRVLLADDQILIRSGFASLISSAEDLEVVGEASDGAEAVRMAFQLRPDVILMDIRMPGMDGITAVDAITKDASMQQVRVVMLTTFEADEYVMAGLQAGASGFLDKSVEPEELFDAIRVVARGDAMLSPRATRSLIDRLVNQPPGGPASEAAEVLEVLTDREREIVALVAHGLSNQDIAERLSLSPLTVKTHVSRATHKLEVRDRAQLVAIAYQVGLVRP